MDQSLQWLNFEEIDGSHVGSCTQPPVLRRDAGMGGGACKRVSTSQLAPPLTPQVMETVLHELPEGTSNAVNSCYACLKANRFSADEFNNLLKSVSSQSATLARIFDHSDCGPSTAPACASKQGNSPRVLSLLPLLVQKNKYLHCTSPNLPSTRQSCQR
jgi:hypothetical protein